MTVRWYLVGPVYDAAEHCTYLRIEATRGQVGTQHVQMQAIDRSGALARIPRAAVEEMEAMVMQSNADGGEVYASYGWRL